MADSKSTHQIEISAIDKATNVINGIDSRFKSLGRTIDKALAVVGVAGVSALTGAIVKSVKEAAAEEQVMKRLQTAIEATGKSYFSVSNQVNSLLKSQQSLTQFADDQSAGALATLIQLTQNYDLSMKALVVTEDLAASGLFDLDSAATAVGKALTGNVMLLQRMGIKLKEGDDVLAKLSERFGGTAAKNVDTFSGRINQLRNAISDAFGAVGSPMLEPLKDAAKTLTETIASPEMQKRLAEFGKTLADAIPKAVTALIEFSQWVIQNGNTILNFFKALIALRVASWAISTGAALMTLAPAISAALAAAISPAGLIVLAAASGTTIGLTIGHAIAKAIRDSRPQDAIPDVLKDFVGPPAMQKFPLVGSGLNAQNLGTQADNTAKAVQRLVTGLTSLEDKILGSLFFGANTTLWQDKMKAFSDEELRVLGSPFGSRGTRSPEFVARDEFSEEERRVLGRSFMDTPAGSSISQLEERIQSIAPAFQFAMTSVTNAIVQGAITGALKIKDVFNALRNAIMQILAELAARAAVAGLLSLFFPSIGFAGAFKGLSTGNFTGGGASSFRPSPIGANPGASGFGGGRPVVINIYGSGQIQNISDLERELAGRIQRGQSKLNKFL